MLDPNNDLLESAVREIILDICQVLCTHGYDTVPVGAIMRLVGVDSDHAKQHDNEYLALDIEFKIMLESRNLPVRAPKGVTLH